MKPLIICREYAEGRAVARDLYPDLTIADLTIWTPRMPPLRSVQIDLERVHEVPGSGAVFTDEEIEMVKRGLAFKLRICKWCDHQMGLHDEQLDCRVCGRSCGIRCRVPR